MPTVEPFGAAPMRTIRRTAALIVAAAAIAAPAAADAATPKIVTSGVAKALPPAKAKQLQERMERTGRYPAGPRLASKRGLDRVRQPAVTAPAPSPGAEQILLAARPPAGSRLFGFQGTYAQKRWNLIQWINYTYSRAVPEMGGRFSTPSVYEVAHGGRTPTGCGAVYNAMYCPAVNTIGFSASYGQAAFTNIGDSAFAGLLAHEYGHGVQQWMQLRGGLMNSTQYSEAFADCMAGGWLATMYNWGYMDNVGRGDWREYLDVLTNLSDATTTAYNHGRPEWRHQSAVRGWNYGMQGCVAWARQLQRIPFYG